ncbi:MAG: lycopene cyclase family protein [Vulcanimicrobiaceae bacterium]
MRPSDRSSYRFAILGAGLAGLSLARAFARCGMRDRIVIVDAKAAFRDDRTWSFWDTDASADARLAFGRWHAWQLVVGRDAHVQHSASAPYVAVRSADFYASARAEIEAAGFEIALGERVTDVAESDRGCVVDTSQRRIRADVVFDARGLTAAMVEASAVVQRFVGRRIVTAGDAFDPAVATLMDVQVDTDDGFHFYYVLPLSSREALVENTYFARVPIQVARLDAELDAYVARRFGRTVAGSGYREVGAIPMSAARTAIERTRRVVPIGLRGGCARPGSGYTFHRVAMQTAAIAAAFAADAAIVPGASFALTPPTCDAWLIAAARHAPSLLPGAFARLFARTDGDRVARFMMDRAGALESFPVLAASALGAARTLIAQTGGRASSVPPFCARARVGSP